MSKAIDPKTGREFKPGDQITTITNGGGEYVGCNAKSVFIRQGVVRERSPDFIGAKIVKEEQ